ncbi:hypothetical protein [Halopelagius fulvigenes]|uniref:Small CPxCG-related zinc finger protein n=1 Tax=Halopelagius fulvigenes TaxID=1198324 RepID=A0ABD5TYI3_9EURY
MSETETSEIQRFKERGYFTCPGCDEELDWDTKVAPLKDGEPYHTECVENADAVARIIYCSDTHGNSWHRLGDDVVLSEVS